MLVEKLVEGILSDDVYKSAEKNYNTKLFDLKQQKKNLGSFDKDMRKFIQSGVYLLKNFKELYNRVEVSLKQKLLSSIIKEKMVFTREKVRTPIFADGFDYIFSNIRRLESIKQKKRRLQK